jgi:hypothetical protein
MSMARCSKCGKLFGSEWGAIIRADGEDKIFCGVCAKFVQRRRNYFLVARRPGYGLNQYLYDLRLGLKSKQP